MNATKLFAGCLALSCLCGCPWAVPSAAADSTLLLVPSLLGQAGKDHASSADRKKVEVLLQRARVAMREKQFETADRLIGQAEELKVEFGLLHVGDTPKKARRDLEAKRGLLKAAEAGSAADAKNDAAARASGLAGPAGAGERETGAKPAPRGASPPAASAAVDGLPPLDESTPEPPAVSKPNPIAAPTGGNDDTAQRQRSDSLLHEARRALAVGDARRANEFAKQAKELGARYLAGEDNPAKVEAAIQRHLDVFSADGAPPTSEVQRRQRAVILLDEAQQLLKYRDFEQAEHLAGEAGRMGASFGATEVGPEAMLKRIAQLREAAGISRASAPVDRANAPGDPAVRLAGGTAAEAGPYPTTKAVYDPASDPTRNRPASAQSAPKTLADDGSATPLGGGAAPPEGATAQELFEAGERALKEHKKDEARRLFARAYELRDQLDPLTARRVQGHLQLLAAPTASARSEPENLLDAATAEQRLLAKQLSQDVARRTEEARKRLEKEPKAAIEAMKMVRQSVEASSVEGKVQSALLARIDTTLKEMERFVADNRLQLELDEQNREVLEDVNKRRFGKLEIDQRLADLVEQYNEMMKDRRFDEAEVVAKRARELDPENPVVVQLIRESAMIRSLRTQMANRELRDEGFQAAMQSVDDSAIPLDDRIPFQMPTDIKRWQDLTDSRRERFKRPQRLNDRELEIQRKLTTPISARFQNRPLGEVLQQLAKLAGINLHIDERGLAQEAVATDTLVTLDLTNDISLKSALMILLEPLHLSYTIRNEVLNITSEQMRAGNVYTVTYPVGDLVIPIPNFVPSSGLGLAGAIQDAHARLGVGAPGGFMQPTAVIASADGRGGQGTIDPTVMAQMQRFMPSGGRGPTSGVSNPITNGFGPGGMGGGAQADFDSLIDLITQTVQPPTWDENGGQGSIAPFQTNLSLVISQTQEIHEQIVDLLEQLRRQQDLQVTIEVRFITLNDRFFERIGVDFQFNIEDHADGVSLTTDTHNPSGVVGLSSSLGSQRLPSFQADKDLPFRQGSFGLALPTFGGFDAASSALSAGQFGFAILSDIEAYFLINAAQGDTRSNVLQAPKVTLFNGQQAFVTDTTQTPFVVSVIPVVGDFAAAQQPVIAVLSEGTFLTVQAVISEDRRFVRLTVVPFFSQIGKVDRFTFSGSSTTTKNTSKSSTTGNNNTGSSDDKAEETVTSEGVTVQLPSFSFVTVTTTVSVPDGGTVLLGGIKRLSEGRSEFGVPILSKLPYINRLFKNVGIGRDTQSLMMMVTPRIIIQEEEEDRLGIRRP